MTKPRFIREHGHITLLPNPTQGIDDCYRLLNPTYLAHISRRDQLYRDYKDKYGVDMAQGRHFPYTLSLIRSMVGLLRHGRPDRYWGAPDKLYKVGTEASDLMRYVALQFLTRSRKTGSTPIVLIHCDIRRDLTGMDYMDAFLRFIRNQGVLVINIRDILLPEITSGNVKIPELLAPGGHYSPLANYVIADKLAPLFRLLIDGKHEAALSAYPQILQSDIDYCKAHYTTGLAYTTVGEYMKCDLERALYHCLRAIQIDGQRVKALTALATVYEMRGEPRKASSLSDLP